MWGRMGWKNLTEAKRCSNAQSSKRMRIESRWRRASRLWNWLRHVLQSAVPHWPGRSFSWQRSCTAGTSEGLRSARHTLKTSSTAARTCYSSAEEGKVGGSLGLLGPPPWLNWQASVLREVNDAGATSPQLTSDPLHHTCTWISTPVHPS